MIVKKINDIEAKKYFAIYDYRAKKHPDKCCYMYGRKEFGIMIFKTMHHVDLHNKIVSIYTKEKAGK